MRPTSRAPGPTSAARSRRSASRRPTSPAPRRRVSALLRRPLPVGVAALARARDRELAGRRVGGDGRAAADGGAVADLHRRHQDDVAADVGVGADGGAVLVRAVVVGGDRAGAVVDPLADVGIAEVGEVVGLGAAAEGRVLDLDEVADVDLGAELGAAAQAGERTDDRACADARAEGLAVDVGVGPQGRAGGDAGVADDAVGADASPSSPSSTSPSKMQPTSISTSLPQASLPRRSKRAGSARRTPSFISRSAARRWKRRSRSASCDRAVDAEHLGLARGARSPTTGMPLGDGEGDDVGQVVLAGGVVVLQAPPASASAPRSARPSRRCRSRRSRAAPRSRPSPRRSRRPRRRGAAIRP